MVEILSAYATADKTANSLTGEDWLEVELFIHLYVAPVDERRVVLPTYKLHVDMRFAGEAKPCHAQAAWYLPTDSQQRSGPYSDLSPSSTIQISQSEGGISGPGSLILRSTFGRKWERDLLNRFLYVPAGLGLVAASRQLPLAVVFIQVRFHSRKSFGGAGLTGPTRAAKAAPRVRASPNSTTNELATGTKRVTVAAPSSADTAAGDPPLPADFTVRGLARSTTQSRPPRSAATGAALSNRTAAARSHPPAWGRFRAVSCGPASSRCASGRAVGRVGP